MMKDAPLHTLGQGGALQRLMRLVECPFLALSATIGNAESLQSFWSTVRGTHIDVISGFSVRAVHLSFFSLDGDVPKL